MLVEIRKNLIILFHTGYRRNLRADHIYPALKLPFFNQIQRTVINSGAADQCPCQIRIFPVSRQVQFFGVAFDLLPASEDLNTYFAETYEESLGGIDPERAELYRICEQQGVGITVMKGYAGGRLFSPQTSPFGVALTPVQCIHYALTRPAVASILTGCDTPEHVKEAAAYETAKEEEKDYASVLAKAPHHAYSGQCTYCGHCAPCPVQIDIAMVNKLYDLAVMQEEIPASLRAHYEELSANAEDCIGCGGCEERCPFGVPVIERMEKARELFLRKN